MQNNLPSDLRRNIDLLSAQFDPATVQVDPALVMRLCQNISMAVSDKSKPIPGDIFVDGIHPDLMRCALAGMVMGVIQLLHQGINRAAQKGGKLSP